MKRALVFKYILSLLFLISFITSTGQNNELPKQDDEFNLFLLGLLSIFACAMIGAAIIGAMAASLLVIALFGLTALGILSTSIAVGLYQKSVSAGFKTLLTISFALSGTILGMAVSLLARRLFEIQVASTTLIPVAGVGGAIGGTLLGLATFTVIRLALKTLSKRFKTS